MLALEPLAARPSAAFSKLPMPRHAERNALSAHLTPPCCRRLPSAAACRGAPAMAAPQDEQPQRRFNDVFSSLPTTVFEEMSLLAAKVGTSWAADGGVLRPSLAPHNSCSPIPTLPPAAAPEHQPGPRLPRQRAGGARAHEAGGAAVRGHPGGCSSGSSGSGPARAFCSALHHCQAPPLRHNPLQRPSRALQPIPSDDGSAGAAPGGGGTLGAARRHPLRLADRDADHLGRH